MKLPSFQFYPGDWMKDPNLRRCTRAARGMWMDMLCLMFECEDRGVLSTDKTAWSDEEIASATSGDVKEGISCISELLRKGVAHRNEYGAIYSTRMVKDEKVRAERAEAGSKGGIKAQTNVKQTESKQVSKIVANGKQNEEQNSSPSSSTSIEKEKEEKAVVASRNGILAENVNAVFDHWKTVMEKPTAKLTQGRYQKVACRLKEGYTVDQLKLAIDGCRASKFHMGENDTNMLHNDLELICRSGEKVEKFSDIARKPAASSVQRADALALASRENCAYCKEEEKSGGAMRCPFHRKEPKGGPDV